MGLLFVALWLVQISNSINAAAETTYIQVSNDGEVGSAKSAKTGNGHESPTTIFDPDIEGVKGENEKYLSIPSYTDGNKSGLCGYPPFVYEQKCHINATISSCMDYRKTIAFGVMIAILGMTIIGTNTLIAVVVIINAGLRTHHYFIKASLALADTIVGFLLLLSVIPNVVWVTKVSKYGLIYFHTKDINSPNAVVVGSTLTASTVASIFHLMFLSIERFTAIKWPFWHMRRTTRSVVHVIALLWVAAVVTSIVPAAFPEYFAYQFQPTLLIHIMTLRSVDGADWRGMHYGIVTIIIPYMIMVVFCLATAITSFLEIRKSKKIFGRNRNGDQCGAHTCAREDGQHMKDGRNNPEIAVFITIGLMIVAFTVTLVPFTILTILFITGYLDCKNYTIPYVTFFYLGLFNSLANGIIYSVRDEKLVNAARTVLCRSRRFPIGCTNTI